MTKDFPSEREDKIEMKFNLILFEDFETLDLFGPIEILARKEGHTLHYYSMSGGMITSAQGTQVMTEAVSTADPRGVMVLPGGRGTRPLVQDKLFLELLAEVAQQAEYCLSICTGSALLAKAGVLDGYKATSNKRALDWVMSNSSQVFWQKSARWVVDGKYYTASGVSAGMDMALGFMADRYGMDEAKEIAAAIEYEWNSEKEKDPFAI